VGEVQQIKKPIGRLSAISIGIGGMIGAGIFSIMGLASQIAGNLVYLSFIIAGMVALLCTYSYAKLGAKYPSRGGPVEFLIRGFGDGVLSGSFNIFLWIGYIFTLALYAKAFGSYARTFLPPDAPGISANLLGTLIILIFTAVNFIGAKAVARSELVIVVIKVGVLIGFSILGFFFIEPSLLSLSESPGFFNVLFGAGIVFIAFEGFGLITNAADDMEDPEKTLPDALYMSVLIVILVYVLVALTVIGNLPIADIIKAQDYVLAEAAKPFLGLIGFEIMAIAALFSTASAINATLYGGANVSYALAKKGELPAFFERKVWGEGAEGLLITSGIVILTANFLDLSGIAMLGSASFLLIYLAVNLAHLRLYTETGANPYIIWASIFGCIFVLGVLIYYGFYHSHITLLLLAIVLLAAFLIESVYRRSSKRRLKVSFKGDL
jgi:amino acid transporter